MVRRSVEPMLCHREHIIAEYKKKTEDVFDLNEEKKKQDRKNLNKKSDKSEPTATSIKE